MKFERKDTDVTAGYMFVPYFGIFAEYKVIDAPMKYTSAVDFSYSDRDLGSWKMKGPGIGLLANAPLGESSTFYASLAFLKLDQDIEYPVTAVSPVGSSSSFDMVGFSVELGTAIAFSSSLSSTIGFKYQTLWGDETRGFREYTHYQDFYGLTLGMSYTF